MWSKVEQLLWQAFKKGDVVLQINDMPVKQQSELLEIIAQHIPVIRSIVKIER